ncbi:MAG: 50S ribosomal protein L17 [bacterium]|nr:50S ribosomal protein L17 [bacterium]
MRHQKDSFKLGRHTSHRKALMRNMVTSLILHEKIETTLAKAKIARRFAERMITLGKKGTLHARRQAAQFVYDPEAVSKLFDGLSARFKERSGGYTRIFKLGFRQGDAAPMAILEYLDRPAKPLKAEAPVKKVKAQKESKTVEKVEKKVPEKKAKEAPGKSTSPKRESKGGGKKSSAPKSGILSRLRGRSKKGA